MCNFLGISDPTPFFDFARHQFKQPQPFSSGINLRPKPVSRGAVLDFVTDHAEAGAFGELIDSLGLWRDKNDPQRGQEE